MKPTMRQRHYNEIIRGLGIAMKEFREIEGDEAKARKHFEEFVLGHYLSVWLEIDDPQ